MVVRLSESRIFADDTDCADFWTSVLSCLFCYVNPTCDLGCVKLLTRIYRSLSNASLFALIHSTFFGLQEKVPLFFYRHIAPLEQRDLLRDKTFLTPDED